MAIQADRAAAAGNRMVASSDGTLIGYEAEGQGPPLIMIGGILSDRTSLLELSRALAADATVVAFDRRGRGTSGDGRTYAVRREVEDVTALAGLFDQYPVLFGHSSGAGLAIEVAAAGVPVRGIVLYEPPYGLDDADSRNESVSFATAINAKLDNGDRSAAVRSFFEGMGLPPEDATGIANDPVMQERAHTIAYDLAVMGMIERDGIVPRDLLCRIDVPTLVLTGDSSPPFFGEVAGEVAGAFPHGTLRIVPESDHSAQSDQLPAIVRSFLQSLQMKGCE